MPKIKESLLPSGFYDLLPPEASFESELVYRAMHCCAVYGYEHVKPPLVEFDTSLLANSGKELERKTFRLMDPLSQHMMGVRADITMQIGRLSLTRLRRSPMPLRLCYDGVALQTISGNSQSPARQTTQVGAELIGVDSAAADTEAIMLAVKCLQKLGVKRITVDINLPPLVQSVLDEAGIGGDEAKHILHALAHKDITAIATLPETTRNTLAALTEAIGPYSTAISRIKQLTLPNIVKPILERLEVVMHNLPANFSDVQFTLDATENRGFDYHTGISFSIFASGIEGEIARGGRYKVAFDGKTSATGFTIYISRLLPILLAPAPKPRIYLPAGTALNEAEKLHAEGYVTVTGLEDENPKHADVALIEARRLNCGFCLLNGKIIKLENNKNE